jgi:SAM-dependent methyltransferase
MEEAPADAGARTARDFGTELPGLRATRRQLALAGHRYLVVAERARGKELLEVACGPGQGLDILARSARRVVAGDLTPSNLDLARAVAPTIPLFRLDAHHLPFPNASFDVVAILEGIYYLADAPAFAQEAARVLRPGGELIVGTVNPAGRDFGKPPGWSTRFYDSRALTTLLAEAGLRAQVFGAFPSSASPRSRAASALRAISSRLGIPWPSWIRWAIRRIVHGAITRYPASFEVPDDASPHLERIEPDALDRVHAVLYAIGTKDAV